MGGWKARPAWQRRVASSVNSSRTLEESAGRGRCGPTASGQLQAQREAASGTLGLWQAWLPPGRPWEGDEGRPLEPTA